MKTLVLIFLLFSAQVFADSADCHGCAPELEGTITTSNVPILADATKIAAHTSRSLSSEKITIEAFFQKHNDGFCLTYKSGDYKFLQKAINTYSSKELGRDISIEEAYKYIRCNAGVRTVEFDLARMPMRLKGGSDDLNSTIDMVRYFLSKSGDSGTTEIRKILSCQRRVKRVFRYGCVDVFEHIDKDIERRKKRGIDTIELDRLKHWLSKMGVTPLYDDKFCSDMNLDSPSCKQR